MEWFAGLFAAYVGMGLVGMALVGVGLFAAIVFSFMEKGPFAFLGLVAAGVGLNVFGGVDAIGAVVNHPLLAVGAFLGYFAVGAAWSVARFFLYTNGLKAKFAQFKSEWLSRKGASSVESLDPAELARFREEAKNFMRAQSRYGSFPVEASQHKAVIMFWMGWWPVSMVGYVLDEPIKRLMNAIYARFSGVYAKIARAQAAEFLADMGGK